MVKGMRSYAEKQRREMRRRNHIAKDLRGTPKYSSRRIESKKNTWQEQDDETNDDN